ncbi:MAG: hypothetical protein RL198_673 [Actinomycetota bacterium]|jgi:predicted GNAT family acetyltransferase
MQTKVTHEAASHRFEIWLDSERVGLMDYTVRPGEIHLTHTEVDPAHRGKSLAAILLRESLNQIRELNLGKVVPVCSYTVKYMELHPETHDLLLNPIAEAAAACKLPKRTDTET